MLSTKVEELLNAQVEKEGYSSLLYLSMASWAETKGFPGISQWLYAQADEEKNHMLEFVHYINDRGGKALISGLKKPQDNYQGIKQLFNDVMSHEQFISASINDIVGLCIEERDYTTQNWLQAFVAEQIEEEASVQAILDRLNLIGDNNMYMFDRDILSMRSASTDSAE
ncbi:MAG: ferritin [Bacteroidales bacterium]|nr:ferritin [Bacteroidales bacterium]